MDNEQIFQEVYILCDRGGLSDLRKVSTQLCAVHRDKVANKTATQKDWDEIFTFLLELLNTLVILPHNIDCADNPYVLETKNILTKNV